MNILLLHNLYQNRGGEDVVVEAESALLRAAGHRVNVETVANDEIRGLSDKLATFFNAPFDPARRQWIRELIASHRPDVVHVHNFFPLLTPAVHEGAAEAGVAVVQTLHNYRLVCAGALLMRSEQICEKCVGGSKAWGVAHRCYRGSVAGSFAIVRMQARARRNRTWTRYVHRFIALTEFGKAKFVQDGFPAERVIVKPNFAFPAPVGGGERRGALFVGRLSLEKGVHVLVQAWRQLPNIPLTIVGEGPERGSLETLAPSNVRFLGPLESSEVRRHMTQAQALIMPSLWYEGFPMTIVEAFSCGLPVIAPRLGAMAELVANGRNGILFAPGDAVSLAAAACDAFAVPAKLTSMGEVARETYTRLYTPERNVLRLEEIYAQAIATSRSMRT